MECYFRHQLFFALKKYIKSTLIISKIEKIIEKKLIDYNINLWISKVVLFNF